MIASGADTKLCSATLDRSYAARTPARRTSFLVEERIPNVMVDEIGHVTFNRYASGPRGVAFARRLYPLMKHAFQIGPEYRDLCAHLKDDIVPAGGFEMQHLPEEVLDRGFWA